MKTSILSMATHWRVVSEMGSIRQQSDGEGSDGQVGPGREVVVDDTEEIVWDAIRIRVLETSINARVINMLVMETSVQSGNLFRLKIIKALLAEQVCNKMSELLNSELKYVMAINWFTVKLEKTEEDS